MNRSHPLRPNSNLGGDRSNVGLFATSILPLFSQENPIKGITCSLAMSCWMMKKTELEVEVKGIWIVMIFHTAHQKS